MLKISVVYFMWNPEICQDPPTCSGQDDLVLLMITLVYSKRVSVGNNLLHSVNTNFMDILIRIELEMQNCIANANNQIIYAFIEISICKSIFQK